MFQHFLFRYPTVQELDDGREMVDGFQSIAFLQIGDSKEDYMDIFFASGDYFEGQVRSLFLKYLFREPTSGELLPLVTAYRSNLDYFLLQAEILSLDEYIGL